MEEGYLCESVHDWQRERTRCIKEDDMPYSDMAWRVDGNLLRDIRHVYMASSFMRILFETPMEKGIEYDKDTSMYIYDIDEKFSIFESIRVFCHTGLVKFSKGETILKTLERYSAFHMYDIEGGKTVLRKLIMDKLTPVNAVQAFEYAVHRDDVDLIKAIRSYMVNYAFVIFKHRNFSNIGIESMAHLADLCSDSNLNIKELDLLEIIYKLCEKKIGEKDYQEFKDPMDIMKHSFGDSKYSIWDTIRMKEISMGEFMGFVNRHTSCMTNDDIVDIMKKIYDNGETKEKIPGKKRKLFQMVSSYPRNLNICYTGEPQGDITHWDRDKVQLFFVFDSTKRGKIALPSTLFKEWKLRCSVNIDKNLSMKGSIVTEDENVDNVTITTKFVNFRHDRWKKTTVTCQSGEFHIPNMLSWNAIEGPGAGGYMFDIEKYPEYSADGTWLMMSMIIEREKNDAK